MAQNKNTPFRTVLTISVGFGLLFLLFKVDWLLYTSLIIGGIGITSTWLSEKIDFLWMKLSWLLSLIVPNIVLTIIFFVVLFPIAMLSRLFGKKDTLLRKNKLDSLFIGVQNRYEPKNFERSF